MRTLRVLAGVVGLGLLWADAAGAWAVSAGVGEVAARALTAQDVTGQQVQVAPDGGPRVVVLVFVATDCPISNRYMPELLRVEREFRGARMWFVYPNLTETAEAIRAHQAAYGASGDVLRDGDQRLARVTGAKVTPEAAVLVRDGETMRVVYTGRIDDRYVSIGQERPRATRHDLEEAVGAAVAGRTVAGPGGPAVGCGIVGTR